MRKSQSVGVSLKKPSWQAQLSPEYVEERALLVLDEDARQVKGGSIRPGAKQPS